jgi:hypothetical protein
MPVSLVAPAAVPLPRFGLARVLACLGGGLCVATLAFLMQLALAHPAGAATSPVSGLLSTTGAVVSSSPVPAVTSPVAQTVGTVGQTAGAVVQTVRTPNAGTVGQTVGTADQTATTIVQSAGSLLGSTTAPVLDATPVGSVLVPVTQRVTTLAGSNGSPIPGLLAKGVSRPIAGGSFGTMSPTTHVGPQGAVVPAAGTTATTVASATSTRLQSLLGLATASLIRTVVDWSPPAVSTDPTSFNASGGSDRAPAPARRPPPLFPSPAGTTSDASSPAHGSSPLDALPPMGLLLPALIAFGMLIGRRRRPLLLFDMRFAPPG